MAGEGQTGPRNPVVRRLWCRHKRTRRAAAHMKIMIFLHGTTIMHRSALGRTRAERVSQVVNGDGSIADFASYVPVENSALKLQTWKRQGAEIVYLSSHTNAEDVRSDDLVLRTHGFPEGRVVYRQAGGQYADLAASVRPDVLIEDDCESIGGETQMVYPHIPPDLRKRVSSIVVKEFGGIDHLPDDIDRLLGRRGQSAARRPQSSRHRR